MVDQSQATEGGNNNQPVAAEPYDPFNDPSRKAKSKHPGWKYGFWPEKDKKDFVQCVLCGKRVHAGIGRLKRHLAGGYEDVEKCANTTTSIMRGMRAFLTKNSRSKVTVVDSNDEAEGGGGEDDEETIHPSSGTTTKRKHTTSRHGVVGTSMVKVDGPPTKVQKSVASMLRKTPKEVVVDRHSKGASQTTIENCFKKNKEDKQKVDLYVADFWYECGLPFSAINSRSWEIVCESIGQYGPGYISPSYHEVRVPLLEKAKKKTGALRDRHELAWQEYGCTLMSDGWTDKRTRHLINFLVNSPAGTFLESVDVSHLSADATMLADLLEKQINQVGRNYVVQVVTDNGANFKVAGRILMERIPTLYWTPCAAHCVDLMLEDLCKIPEFSECIAKARRVTTFIYRHARLLDAMRVKRNGRDLVRPATTRFATSFLTLAMENCMRASQPLLIVLRVVDGDERPAMPEVTASMEEAKEKIKHALEHKPRLLKEVLKYVDNRWESQMDQKLYGVALFLNPNRFFELKKAPENRRYCSKLRHMFNEVLWKMVPDDEMQSLICSLADDYERTEGDCFTAKLAIKDRARKNPLLWWGAYGGLAYELQSLAKCSLLFGVGM